MTAIEITTIKGRDIAQHIEALGRFRIEIFREFPYVYDGDMSYETKYLSRYARCNESLLLLGMDAQGIACACTGIPLDYELDEFQLPFLRRGLALADKFYLGEIMIRKDRRAQGLGTRLLAQALATVAASNRYRQVLLCTVLREPNHALKPKDYRATYNLWTKFGFEKLAGFDVEFSWKDIGAEAETKKVMATWAKTLAVASVPESLDRQASA